MRTFPGSRRYPHFNRDALAASLAERGVAYAHRPALGGRRRPRPDTRNTAWRNEGFRGYADHMETPEFRDALEALLRDARETPTVIMCSEAVPWRCHRSLIADAATARGARVLHILDRGTSSHTLTSFARVLDGSVHYDAPPDAPLELFPPDAGAADHTPSR